MKTTALIVGICIIVKVVSSQTCKENQFECVNEKEIIRQCIDIAYVCDGDADCPEATDEPPLVPAAQCPDCDTATQFRCSSGRCINKDLQCNHQDNCGDGSDERGCSNPGCPGGDISYFQCTIGGCIPAAHTCDGVEDCSDGSDEKTEACPCPKSDDFRCTKPEDKPFGACIPREYRCDKIWDCIDGSDEAGC